MAETTDPIEIMARQINSADPISLPGHFHDRAVAWLVLKALDSAGWALVPKESDTALLAQALKLLNADPEARTRPEAPTNIQAHYRAMVEAGRVKPCPA